MSLSFATMIIKMTNNIIVTILAASISWHRYSKHLMPNGAKS